MLWGMKKAPTHIARSIERIRRYRVHKRWSLNRLATEAGLRESSIRKMSEADWNPESKTLAMLEAIIPDTFRGDGTDKPEAGNDEAA
jgi:ribosome-binding protein aMBF1 (putative translation factor)